jgi:hypothetical protein
MEFDVKWARYDALRGKLAFCATGTRDGGHFTVVTSVRCLKDPNTPEKVHMVALLRLTELFGRPSARGW